MEKIIDSLGNLTLKGKECSVLQLNNLPPEYKTFHIKHHLAKYEYQNGGFRVIWREGGVFLSFEDVSIAQQVYDAFHTTEDHCLNGPYMLKHAWKEMKHPESEWKQVKLAQYSGKVTKSISRRRISQAVDDPKVVQERAKVRNNEVAHRMITHALGLPFTAKKAEETRVKPGIYVPPHKRNINR
jgi:hypothetical protein